MRAGQPVWVVLGGTRRSESLVNFGCEEVCRGWDFWTMLEHCAIVGQLLE